MQRPRLLIVLVALFCALVAPAAAHANVAESYVGWGSVTPTPSTSTSATAWEWTGATTGWKQHSRVAGQPVYLQFFATGWEWTWTADAGWLAMRAVDVTGPAPAATVGARLPLSYSLASLTGTVLYVATTGSSTAAGSSTSPLASLSGAIARVPAGATATIVVRGGTYHEGGLAIPADRTIHIMAYPGETPTFTGAQTFSSGWTTSGTTASHAYTAMPVTDGSGISFTTGMGLTGDGIGKRPDQAWVGSQQLQQVSSLAAVVAGTFYVDAAAGRMHLAAADVARGTVAASQLRQFIIIRGAYSSIEGIRVTRYSNTASDYGVIQIPSSASHAMLRDVEVSDSAFQAVNLSGGNSLATILQAPLLDHITVTGSNWMGVASSLVDGLVLRQSRITTSNQFAEFTNAPQSGALKTSRNRGTRVIGNVIANNHSPGLWFDQSNYDVDVVGNTIVDNAGSGIFYEISDNLLFANNYVRTLGKFESVKLVGSSGLRVINNTVVGGSTGIGVFTDSRSFAGCSDPAHAVCSNSMSSDRDAVRSRPATLDWMPRLDLMLNNIVINPTGGTTCNAYTPVCVTTVNATATVPLQSIIHHADPARGIPQTRIDGNVTVNDTYSAHVVYSTPVGNFTSASAFSAAMAVAPVSISGFEAAGKVGTSWVNVDGSPTAALTARNGDAVAIPVDAEINQYLTAGTRMYGRVG